MKEYKWATLGCGIIANELAQAMEKEGRRLYSVANRTHKKALEFAGKYQIGKVYNSIDELFEDDEVDIIYISTPHNTHINYLKKALAKGKHVLCEKSITLNSEELEEALVLAKEHNVVLAEAMTIFHMPIYQRLKVLIQERDLGNLQFIQINFGSFKEYDMNNRFFSKELAGGALLDIGVYAISLARWFMSQAPTKVESQIRLAPTGVDEQAGILLMNDLGEMATISLSLHAKQPKRAMLAYENGYIEIYEFPRGEKATITYTENAHQEVVEKGSTLEALSYEIKDMELSVSNKDDKTHIEYTKDVMKIMTDIRHKWNLLYPEEEHSQPRN